MTATVVIPARFASTRFPAKMLVADTGRPLVQHVVDRVRLCKRVGEVIVAADDQRIVAALEPFGTTCMLTSPDHASGTDRVAEVARRGLAGDLIINVQGDEPEIEPAIVDALAAKLSDDQTFVMATAATPFPPNADPANPNLVKVVTGLDGRAIYFSRSLIPHDRDLGASGPAAYHLHLGIYGFRRDALLEFAGWPPTPLEQAEKLEQLRAVEHGMPIYVLPVDRAAHGIDTREQYDAFVKRHREGVAGG